MNKDRYYKTKNINALGIIILVFLLILTSCDNFSNREQLHRKLLSEANEFNKSCPIMVNRDTRVDNAIIMPDNTWQTYFTLVNSVRQDLNIVEIKADLLPRLINNLKTSPKQQITRDARLTEKYIYKDKVGAFLFETTITPNMYLEN